MSGRIRTIKPEWLDDQKLRSVSLEARILSVALLLMADDHGRGRGHVRYLDAMVFDGNDSITSTARAMSELEEIGYVRRYRVRGQDYFEICNWKKHQRVDRPGAPRVPAPEDADESDVASQSRRKAVYFIRGALTGLIKIGESIDPVARLAELANAGSERLDLLATIANGSRTERELHAMLASDRVHGEWFKPSAAVMAAVVDAGGDPSNPIASAGYDGTKRSLDPHAIRSRMDRESIATDLRSPISDHDHDHDHDLRARGALAPSEPDGSARPPVEPQPEPVQPTLLAVEPNPPSAEREVFEVWLEGWRRVIRGTRPPVLDDKRRRAISARLRDFSLGDLKRAAAGVWRSDWHVENRQTDIALVCRDAAHVERFMALAEPAGDPHSANADLEPPPTFVDTRTPEEIAEVKAILARAAADYDENRLCLDDAADAF